MHSNLRCRRCIIISSFLISYIIIAICKSIYGITADCCIAGLIHTIFHSCCNIYYRAIILTILCLRNSHNSCWCILRSLINSKALINAVVIYTYALYLYSCLTGIHIIKVCNCVINVLCKCSSIIAYCNLRCLCLTIIYISCRIKRYCKLIIRSPLILKQNIICKITILIQNSISGICGTRMWFLPCNSITIR